MYYMRPNKKTIDWIQGEKSIYLFGVTNITAFKI